MSKQAATQDAPAGAANTQWELLVSEDAGNSYKPDSNGTLEELEPRLQELESDDLGLRWSLVDQHGNRHPSRMCAMHRALIGFLLG